MRGRRRTYDYDILDPQITVMYERGMSMLAIANKLGCSDRTVGKRVLELGLEPPADRRLLQRARHYRPPLDECLTMVALLDTLRNAKRKTNEASEKIIATAMHLANKGKLDIKKVAL